MGLMTASSGLTKRKLALATATPDKVSADATYYAGDKTLKTGTLVERGQYQIGGTGSGGSGMDKYFAINALPEGIYRSNGADWAPEARCSWYDLMTMLFSTRGYNPINQEVKGDNNNQTRTQQCGENEVWLFLVMSTGGGPGGSASLTTPNCDQMVNLSINPTRNEEYNDNPIIVRICRFHSGGATVTMNAVTAGGWSSMYFYAYRLFTG